MCTSVPQMVVAVTRMTASPARGRGLATCSSRTAMMPLSLGAGIADVPLSRSRGYLAAVAITAAVVALRLAATPWFGTNVPYFQFYPAILLAAWLGGLGPGLLATGLSAIAAMYF